MSFGLFKDIYLTLTLALVAGTYWPWAEFNGFTLRPFTEGIAVWLIIGLAPVAMSEWLIGLAIKVNSHAKALVHAIVSTYP